MRDISQYETDYTNYSDMSNQFEDAYQVKYRQINEKKQEASGIMVEAKHHKFTFTY